MVLEARPAVLALLVDRRPACSSGHIPSSFLPFSCSSCSDRCSPRSLEGQPTPPVTADFRQARSPHPQGLMLSLDHRYWECLLPSHWLQVTLVFTVCLLDCMLEACLEVFTEISPLLVRLAMEGELVNDITDDMSESYRGVRHSVCALGFNPRHLLPGPAFVQS